MSPLVIARILVSNNDFDEKFWISFQYLLDQHVSGAGCHVSH